MQLFPCAIPLFTQTFIQAECKLPLTNLVAAVKKAQMFVDSEVLRLCSPLVPLDTGTLENSGKLGTTVGSGVVSYIVPYARYQYGTAESRSKDSKRGGKWFERMKADNMENVLDGAQKRMTGKPASYYKK